MKKKLTAALLCIAMLISLCACGGSGEVKKDGLIKDDESKRVDLVWFIRSSEPTGFAEVMEKANEYLNEKLNVTLDLRCIEPGDYASKVQLAVASGEQCDIIWTAQWANNYEANVTKNAYMAIDEYLDLPELSAMKAHYKDEIWDACRVNGKIYGILIEQVLHNQGGMWFMKEYCDKYNFDVYSSVKTTDDLEDIYSTVRSGEPDSLVICTEGYKVGLVQKTEVAGGWYLNDDGSLTDRNDENDFGLDRCERMRRWNQNGFFPADIATLGDTSDLKNNGKLFSNYDRYMAGSEEKTNLQYSYKVCQIPTSDRVISRNSVQSTMSAIGYKCQNPIRALKLVQLLHEDEYLLNLLCYGIEGRDYTKDPSNPKRMIRDTDSYYISEFLIGSQFLAYLAPAYSDDVWEKTKEENENAKIDPNIGFAFDRKPVESELSNISAVSGEYNGLEKGLYDNYEEMFAEMQEKLELAGSKIVKDEIERQYKDWKDNK